MSNHTQETASEREQFVTPGRRTLMLLVVLGLVGFALYGML